MDKDSQNQSRAAQLLEAVFNNATVALFVMDEQQHCTYMNPAAESLTGFSLDEVQGRPLHDVIHHTRTDGRHYPLAECPIDRSFPENNQEQGEEVFVRKDGSFYPVAYTASPLRSGGVSIGTVLEVRDLTEEKQAEALLRESEQRARLAIDTAGLGTWYYEFDSGTVHLDQRMRAIWEETERSKLPLSDILERVHPDDRSSVLDIVADAQGSMFEGMYNAEFRIMRGDGSVRWISAKGQGRLTGEGPDRSAIGFLGTALDVTERKEAEAALQEQSNTMATLNRVGTSLSSELDLQRLVQLVTDASTELSGAEFGAFFYNVIDRQGESYTLYTLSGVPSEAFSKFPMPRNTHVFGPTFRGEGIVRSDDITKDPRYGQNPPYQGMPEGHLPVRSYLAVPVVSRSGTVLGGLFFGHSKPGMFTERVQGTVMALASQAAVAIDNAQLYEEARRLNESLEEKVKQRTDELANMNTALQHRTLELETLNHELETFSYSVSHDLRAPLRGVDGFSAALLEDFGDEVGDTARQYIHRIRAAAKRMGELIDDLLDLSRLSRGEIHAQTVDLSALAGAVADGLKQGDPERKVEFEIARGIEIRGDERLFRIVLENLLGNAWKFTRMRDDARISFSMQTSGGKRIYLVEDNGVGFDPAYADKLFAPFQRLHQRDAFEGNGIGLATVQRIIHKHGGKIWAEGEPDKGARFYFSL